jgi:predicted esterase
MNTINKKILFAIICTTNAALLCFTSSTDRIVTPDEARYVTAGVAHWRLGEFGLANDSPPLARVVAAFPLLPLRPAIGRFEGNRPGHPAGNRDRELTYAGRFMSLNMDDGKFTLFFVARMTNFAWWLLGAWTISRWSGQLYGGMAGPLGVALWCLLPNVLQYESLSTPDLPTAAACVSATYAFRRYLLNPSWDTALGAGALLGAALLAGFASLTLLLIWPLLALVRRLLQAGGSCPEIGHRVRAVHAVAAVASLLYAINLGYGFVGSGTPLGDLKFASRVPDGGQRSPGVWSADRADGDRLRGTRLGRIPILVPADLVEGLDRVLNESGVSLDRPGGEEDGTMGPGRPSPAAGLWAWAGIGGMILGSLLLRVGRHPGSAPWAEELTLWVPALAALALTTHVVGPLSPARGLLLATPFGLVAASKLGRLLPPGRGWAGRAAAALSLWAVVGCIISFYNNYVTPERTARFCEDLARRGRKFGLAVPELRTSAGIGAGERGLTYRTFVDSRGVAVNYALFIPEDYRDDRAYPLILFLHGFGTRGTTGRRFTQDALPFTLRYRSIDFLVLCPQGRSGTWDPSGDDARRAMELLAAVREGYRVDPRRISLTGVSSGGAGVWDLAARYPDAWAAIVPVAASCDPGKASLVKDIPCWCFHNRYDGTAPVRGAREMIANMRALGGEPRYTEYVDAGHGAWLKAYDHPGLYEWLARCHRP